MKIQEIYGSQSGRIMHIGGHRFITITNEYEFNEENTVDSPAVKFTTPIIPIGIVTDTRIILSENPKDSRGYRHMATGLLLNLFNTDKKARVPRAEFLNLFYIKYREALAEEAGCICPV